MQTNKVITTARTNPSTPSIRSGSKLPLKAIGLSATLACCAVTEVSHAGTVGSKVAPPNAAPHGQSLANWSSQYQSWINLLTSATPQVLHHVLFPVVSDVTSLSGTGTFKDPLVLTVEGTFNLKPGTAFFTPLGNWTSEIYEDGHTDPIPPDDWFGRYFTFPDGYVIDGKMVINPNDINRYFVKPQYYNPPVLYPAPTWYGSVGLLEEEGWWALCMPLAAGTHRAEFTFAALLPPDNGLLPEQGLILTIVYTINVVP